MNEPQNWWTKFLTALQNFGQRLVHLTKRTIQQSRSNTEANQQPTPNDWQFKFNVIMSTIRSLMRFVIALLFVGGGLALGLLLGYFSGLMSQESVPTYASMKRQISDVKQSSELYFANNVKLDNVKSDLLRKQISSSEMSPYLKKAIVATEDSDFYNHNGVVPKSLIRAVLGEIAGASVQTGGSTLTQQLVKMQLLSSETTWKRKATEIMLAMRVNKYFSKDEVLESYLNVATFGRNSAGQNIAGVEEAAQGLFGVSAKNLSLPQAAFIAGLPQSPSVYTPYKQNGSLKKDLSLGLKRKNVVLFRMYRNGDITNKQYQAAKKVDLVSQFQEKGTASEQTVKYGYVYNLLLSRARTILIKQLVKQDGRQIVKVKADDALYTKYYNQADTLLKQKGYRIDSTINKSIYDELQTATSQASYTFGQSYTETAYDSNLKKEVTITEPVQVGSIVLDNTTGKVLAFVGGRDYDDNQVNHAFDTLRSPGSTMKPLLVYGPAVENKIINTQTQIADFPQDFNGYKPSDFGQTSLNKFVSATTALEHSYNLPAVNLYNYLLNKTNVQPADYLKKMGITLTSKEISELGIALGGTSQGISVQQDASAFATYANNGDHVDPYVISKITAPDGKVIYQHKETKTSVYSPSTAYIMQHMLKQVVKSGTANSLSWRLNFSTDNVWGKTGTTNDNKDIWFVGSTPGITMATWMGYDNFYGNQHSLGTTASSINLGYWSTMANAIYSNQPDLLKLNKSMSKPSGVKSHSVLESTGTKDGKVTVDGNTINLKGNTVTALFNDDEASDAKAKFAIGGTDKNYKLFYDHYSGISNAYGQSIKMDAKGNVLDSSGNIVTDDDDTTTD
ncbi:penicillin-binding protein [Lapidilactobacillus dextrinicus]|uniref:transglycosylase domain-containing protein n=1 Tax=Lapidilactobacillus dextrinicus TaxID=51664 RepID=UPI00070B3E50|nr:transglycosylase domain-containing protein [Lapidilactobacillus dextrinicus]QFG47219.1 penicillin-binding protein [Lapidilactobacillus dextrinicus]